MQLPTAVRACQAVAVKDADAQAHEAQSKPPVESCGSARGTIPDVPKKWGAWRALQDLAAPHPLVKASLLRWLQW